MKFHLLLALLLNTSNTYKYQVCSQVEEVRFCQRKKKPHKAEFEERTLKNLTFVKVDVLNKYTTYMSYDEHTVLLNK